MKCWSPPRKRRASTALPRARCLASGRYAEEVRRAEQFWRSRGINSVPAVVIDGQLSHLRWAAA